MGIASLILGIIGVICCFLVFVAPFGVILAVIGLILGIVDTVKKSKRGEKKGISIAGLIICAITFVILVIESLIVGLGLLIYAEASDSLSDYNDYYDSYYDDYNYNTGSSSNQSASSFNYIYELYDGNQYGSSVKSLLSTVMTSERKIECRLDGVTYEASAMKNMINSGYKYYVTLYKDIDGYVDEISILTMTSSLE